MQYRISLICALSLAACGDDASDSPDGGALDDAAVTVDADIPSSTIVTVSGDYAGNGVLTTISVPSMEVTINAVAGVAGGDPVLRAHGERLVILDRFGGDSVTVLDKDLQLLGQVSTGAGSNPQDSAIIGDTLYVVALDATGVLVFDLTDLSAGIQSTIDLSALDADDNQPDCNSIFAVGEQLYVSCQLLDRALFAPRGPGKVAVIDATEESVETVLDLTASNPTAHFAQMGNGDLIFSTAPGAIFGASNDAGCVERISTDDPPVLGSCLTSNVDLDAYPRQVLPHEDSILFVNVQDFTSADIRKVSAGAVTEFDLPGLGTNIGNLAVCPTGHLVVDDNTMGARGVRVYDADGLAVNDAPADVGWSEFWGPGNSTICW